MLLRLLLAGTWTVVATVDSRGRCRVMEVLDALRRNDSVARAQIVALLLRCARQGPPVDTRRSRHVGDGVYELKTPRGWRLFYFFDRERLIVCSELCRKPKPRELKAIVSRTQRERAEYFAARSRTAIVTEESTWED